MLTGEEFLLKAEEHCCIRVTEFHNIMNIEIQVWIDLPALFVSRPCSCQVAL